MSDRTIEASHGRWREILPALGVPEKFLDGKHQPCPLCGGTDRARFTDRTGDGDYFCGQCGAGKGLQFTMRFHGWDFKMAADEIDRIIGNLPPSPPQINGKRAFASTDELRLIWKVARPLTVDDPAWRYLAKRGIDLAGRDLRALRLTVLPHHPTGTVHPVMVACLYDAIGMPKQIHRTYLSQDGGKADIVPVRMFMPGKLPIGGAIRLGDAEETMGVAEGIETALSASIMHGIPVWATTSDVMLAQWKPPVQARHIVIFGDADASYAGQAASFELAKRLVHEEREVSVMLPPHLGMDWNDVLTAQTRRRNDGA